MQEDYEKLQEISGDIFDITLLLKEYCSQNHDIQEMQCVYTCIKLLNKMADDLIFKVEEIDDIKDNTAAD